MLLKIILDKITKLLTTTLIMYYIYIKGIEVRYLFVCLLSTMLLNANQFYYEFDKKVEVVPKITKKSVDSSDIHEFITTDGKSLKFKNEILVQCKEDAYCLDDFEDLNLQNVTTLSSSFFLIKLNSSQDIFEYC